MTCPDSLDNEKGAGLEVPIVRLTFLIGYGIMAAITLCLVSCCRSTLNRLLNRFLPDFDNRLVGPTLKTIALAIVVLLWPLNIIFIGIFLVILLCMR